jgi:hydrogenase maturation protein HypF
LKDAAFSCLIRRSRGFVPRTIRLASAFSEQTLAVGGDLKSAPAFARGESLHLAPYIGDLENPITNEAFEKQIEMILELYGGKPERVVFDLHPRYFSTLWAEARPFGRKLRVQHHHAHILSVMAEHDLDRALGLAFDGTGYGTDGTIWGGEFLSATRADFVRLGRFGPFRLPGGDGAVLRPLRIAYAVLSDGGSSARETDRLPISAAECKLLSEMLASGFNSPVTSSLGRIFDAAAAILGFVDDVSYEGEGPIKLEGAALSVSGSAGAPMANLVSSDLLPLRAESGRDGGFRVDPYPLLACLACNRESGDRAALAFLFHRCVAEASLEGARRMRETTGIDRIALSGGVFQNMLLRELLVPALEEDGFRVYLNRAVPAGDGGLALGQAYYTGTGSPESSEPLY